MDKDHIKYIRAAFEQLLKLKFDLNDKKYALLLLKVYFLRHITYECRMLILSIFTLCIFFKLLYGFFWSQSDIYRESYSILKFSVYKKSKVLV